MLEAGLKSVNSLSNSSGLFLPEYKTVRYLNVIDLPDSTVIPPSFFERGSKAFSPNGFTANSP